MTEVKPLVIACILAYNEEAGEWAEDPGFARYLTLIEMNAPGAFRV